MFFVVTSTNLRNHIFSSYINKEKIRPRFVTQHNEHRKGFDEIWHNRGFMHLKIDSYLLALIYFIILLR